MSTKRLISPGGPSAGQICLGKELENCALLVAAAATVICAAAAVWVGGAR